jgi:hypothetical protein
MTQDMESCFFCPMPPERAIVSNELAYALRDGFPVTPLHTIVIPRRHVPDYFGLTNDELLACDALMRRVREMVLAQDTSVEGFNIGINAEIPVATDFYFQPGLLYTIKGAKSEDVILGQSFNTTLKISYLELPLNFLYKPLLGTGHLILGLGPYVAFGVGGKATYEGGGSSISEKIKFQKTVMNSDPADVVYIRPMDAGANMLVGYEFGNKVSFQLNTQLGLTKINPEYEGASNDKTSVKNTGFGFSLGYRF